MTIEETKMKLRVARHLINAEKELVIACKELNTNHILDVEFYDAYEEFTKALQKKVDGLVADAREYIGISKPKDD